MLVDSHCHLDFEEFRGRLPAVLQAMAEADVGAALCICVTLESFPDVFALARDHSNLFASVGVHPDYPDAGNVTVEQLLAFAERPKVVAIGETGLDYYRLKGDLEWQRERFRTHIRAARTCGKPLVVHTRAAAEDTVRIMREERAQEAGGVMHCFTESAEVARAAMALDFYISFSGIVTFKNAGALREVVREVPLDRLLVETDAPYLAPIPMRGKPNEPAFVRYTAAKIAELKGLPAEEVARQTSDNFFRLFRIDRGALAKGPTPREGPVQ
jgi:TatD DNase family protein